MSKPSAILLTWWNAGLLPVLRSLGEVVAHVTVLSSESDPIVVHSRHVDDYRVLPPDADDAAVLQQLEEVAARSGGALLIPVDEPAALLVIRHRERLARSLRLTPLPDPDVFALATSKARLVPFLDQRGFPHPRTLSGTSGNLSNLAWEGWKFPVLLKPDRGSGGLGIHRCAHVAELNAALARVASDEGQFLVQEWIPGSDVDCSFLAVEGEIVAWTTQRAARKPQGFGPASEVVMEEHPGLVRLAEQLCAALRWSGMAHLDTIQDERGGCYQVLELNGRFWTSLLASTAAGVNFPQLLIALDAGQSFGRPSFLPQRFFTAGLGLRRFLGLGGPRYKFRETDLPYVMADSRPLIAAAARKYLPGLVSRKSRQKRTTIRGISQ